MRRAKIICTIGPASDSPAMLDRLIDAGMDAARLNFSHGTSDEHRRAIGAIRHAAAGRKKAVAIIQDLQGPRIRIGNVPALGIDLALNERVDLVTDPSRRTGATNLPVTYARLAADVKTGARVLIDDGRIELRVETVGADAVSCRVIAAGTVRAHKGINFPGTPISAPPLTEKDMDDLKVGVAAGVDYVALSFVRGAADIEAARKAMAECGREVPIIAKIERPEAVQNLDELLEHVDGIMIARGDLGVEMGPEAVPVLQKRMIAHANRCRKLVITATQMLESMTRYAQPTRAEASDVANAVFDGTDAVMLSAETATGDFPVETVAVMDRLVRAAEEAAIPSFFGAGDSLPGTAVFPEAICEATAAAADAVGAVAIVAFTESGATARLLSKQRPAAPIVAFTPFEPVRQCMALYWGVLPSLMPRMADTEARLSEVDRWTKDSGLAKAGDRIVIVSGTIVGQRGGTNVMKLHEVA